MSPHRQLSRRNTWTSAVPREIQESFLGLAFKLHPQPENQNAERELEYAMVVHDGTGVVESETITTHVSTAGKDDDGLRAEVRRVSKEVLGRVRQYEEDRHVKVSLYAADWMLTIGLYDRYG
jgi:hypothetical protein